MAAPSSSAEFLDLVRQSGLVDGTTLDRHLEQARSDGSLLANPGTCAGYLVHNGLLTNFQAEQILAGRWKRFSIGKYKVLEKLGSGSMDSVYLCEGNAAAPLIAVKVLPTALACHEELLQRFHREARALATVKHANIVRAYDINQDEGLHFIVMEFIDGSNLREIVERSGPLAPLRAAHYIRQAALGLQHIHEAAGLVHRDIEPRNIIIDRSGTVKIVDFGIALFAAESDIKHSANPEPYYAGTASYIAPEQTRDFCGVDIRADIYCLGAVFYKCLVGRSPVSGGGTAAQKLLWHQNRQPPPIQTLRPEVPRELIELVEKMLAKDRGDRLQTPREVVEALTPWTQQPIGPPEDIEMPRHCPAIQALIRKASSTR